MRWEFFLLSTEQSYIHLPVLHHYNNLHFRFKQQKTFSVFAQPHINIENFPNPSSVYIRLCIHCAIKKFSIAFQFYEIPFQRKESKTLLKEKFLPTRLKLVLYMKFCAHNQFLLCKKRCFPKYRFFWLKMLTYAKKLTQHVCKDFPSLNKQKNGYNSKLFEFSTQYLFKIFCL